MALADLVKQSSIYQFYCRQKKFLKDEKQSGVLVNPSQYRNMPASVALKGGFAEDIEDDMVHCGCIKNKAFTEYLLAEGRMHRLIVEIEQTFNENMESWRGHCCRERRNTLFLTDGERREDMKQCRQKRATRQKKVIYDVLCSTHSHPTADWIYAEARKHIPDISLGTIYRNLQAMAEEGIIMELNYGKEQRRYDGDPSPHYHFVCEKCGRVLDFAADCPKVGKNVLSSAPGTVNDYRFECYGVCRDCLD